MHEYLLPLATGSITFIFKKVKLNIHDSCFSVLNKHICCTDGYRATTCLVLVSVFSTSNVPLILSRKDTYYNVPHFCCTISLPLVKKKWNFVKIQVVQHQTSGNECFFKSERVVEKVQKVQQVEIKN